MAFRWFDKLFGVVNVELTKLTPTAQIPKYATDGAAGMDLYADQVVTLPPGGVAVVQTNIAIALPPGYEAQVRPRSGLAITHGLTVLNAPGTIDSDYRGAIGVILINHGSQHYTVFPGGRIAQLVIAKVERARFIQCDTLDETARGSGGYGSTGYSSVTGA